MKEEQKLYPCADMPRKDFTKGVLDFKERKLYPWVGVAIPNETILINHNTRPPESPEHNFMVNVEGQGQGGPWEVRTNKANGIFMRNHNNRLPEISKRIEHKDRFGLRWRNWRPFKLEDIGESED